MDHAKELSLMLNYADKLIEEKRMVASYFERLSGLRKYRMEDSIAEDFHKLWMEFDVDNDQFDQLFSCEKTESKFMQAMKSFDGFRWLLENNNSDGMDGDLGLAFLIVLSCVKATPERKIAIREYFMTMKEDSSFFSMLDNSPVIDMLKNI